MNVHFMIIWRTLQWITFYYEDYSANPLINAYPSDAEIPGAKCKNCNGDRQHNKLGIPGRPPENHNWIQIQFMIY